MSCARLLSAIGLACACAAIPGEVAGAPAAARFADAPVIRLFAARVVPCADPDLSCIDLRWRATDAGSPRLRFELVVDHSSGRRAFEGAGRFRSGRTVSASLEPRARPACGRYSATLTVTDDQGLLTAATRALVRRRGCG
jgi:hypothetical protein